MTPAETQADEDRQSPSVGNYLPDDLFNGYNLQAAKDAFHITYDQYVADRDVDTRGTTNPTLMENPFWRYMIYENKSVWKARATFEDPQDPRDSFHSSSESKDLPEDQDPLEDQDHPEDQGRLDNIDLHSSPGWCFNRFGATRPKLPDGRTVCIGGEHEDSYDPDFYIYNGKYGNPLHKSSYIRQLPNLNTTTDVVVIAAPQQTAPPPPLTPSAIQIYGYVPLHPHSQIQLALTTTDSASYSPSIFPPTDFHTSTYIEDPTTGNSYIIIIGALGYQDATSRHTTEVYQLSLRDFSIARIKTVGEGPVGGTAEHSAELVDSAEGALIVITRQDSKLFGEVLREVPDELSGKAFALRIRDWRWTPWNNDAKPVR